MRDCLVSAPRIVFAPDLLEGEVAVEPLSAERQLDLEHHRADGFAAVDGDGQGHLVVRHVPGYLPLTVLLPFMRGKHFWWAEYMGDPRLRGAQLFHGERTRFDLAQS